MERQKANKNKSMKAIYVITTLKPPTYTRTVAWYESLKSAKRCIEENWCDIHEGDYMYAIIEKTKEGLYPVPAINECWYKWVSGKYVETKKPISQKNVCGFGIG